MEGLHLVTGATGHLGNSLVRALLAKGKKVRASARNLNYQEPFAGLNCELVYAELTDKKSLYQALEGVEILYQVAAVFKHWSKDPKMEIIDANLRMTQNILEAAAEQGVKKVIYVSSIAAIDRKAIPLDETTWNKDFQNPYFHSKTVSEQLAWRLADKLNLQMVTVLPSAIIGPNAFIRFTPTMNLFMNILNNKLPFDPDFNFNFVHVMDVAGGMIAAAEKGRCGERYVLATEPAIEISKVIQIARALFPDIKMPQKIDYASLMNIATSMEKESEITGQTPLLLRSNVELYYQADERIDISKAKKELGYDPMSPEEAIKETFIYLKKREAGR